MKGILFCLDKCIKCTAVKDKIKTKNIDVVTLSKDQNLWSSDEFEFVMQHGVLDDLKKTAPILVLEDGTKIIGQIRIMRWLQNV